MSLNLLDGIQPEDLIAFIRQMPMPDDHLITREILKETLIQSVKYRIKRTSNFTNVASFRAWNAEAVYGRREVQHSITEGLLPPVSQKFLVGELEQILLDIERGADNGELIDEVYDDAQRGVNAIRARLELAAGQLLQTGQFNLTDENGLTISADFQVPAANMPVVTTFWDQAGATPLSDEIAWVNYQIQNGWGIPGGAMTSLRVLTALAKSHDYQEAFFARGVTNYPMLNFGQVNQVRAMYGLPQIQQYDTQVRVDGVSQRVTSDNRFWLLPADVSLLGETQYGITAESIALNRQANSGTKIAREDMPGIITTVSEDDDPIRVETRSTAVAMPLLFEPRLMIAAQVLS